MGNNASRRSQSEGRSFGDTSFLEQAGAASIFKCGNPDKVVDEDNNNKEGKNNKNKISLASLTEGISPTAVCTTTGKLLDEAVKWRNTSGCDNPVPECRGVNGAEDSDDDEFQSLRKLQDDPAVGLFARSLAKEISTNDS